MVFSNYTVGSVFIETNAGSCYNAFILLSLSLKFNRTVAFPLVVGRIRFFCSAVVLAELCEEQCYKQRDRTPMFSPLSLV